MECLTGRNLLSKEQLQNKYDVLMREVQQKQNALKSIDRLVRPVLNLVGGGGVSHYRCQYPVGTGFQKISNV